MWQVRKEKKSSDTRGLLHCSILSNFVEDTRDFLAGALLTVFAVDASHLFRHSTIVADARRENRQPMTQSLGEGERCQWPRTYLKCRIFWVVVILWSTRRPSRADHPEPRSSLPCLDCSVCPAYIYFSGPRTSFPGQQPPRTTYCEDQVQRKLDKPPPFLSTRAERKLAVHSKLVLTRCWQVSPVHCRRPGNFQPYASHDASGHFS